ncbi:polysaccharide biosynthesis/export family protein [Massilia sp. PAMC28688]|uniref:polysaccharide biosynthesis/export family protein n=1 Tax=Massilia sp. PAMC28688 TaxID=2861283 RepID=UPI001C62645F|nr:polysaccharide biosynthesis/export family protein [Massilia sp. PAMC28688]QYF93530.1 polysaccharide biosynthesis/export family protein [Massilia sp. PAMC28688]
MKTFQSSVWSRIVLIAFLALLGGCASHAVGAMEEGTRDEPGPPTDLITEQLIAAERAQREQHVNKHIVHLIVRDPPPYTIDKGDVLSIVVWDHPELAGQGTAASSAMADMGTPGAPAAGFVVDHEGRLQFPFAGVLTVAGLTEEQARSLLTRRLSRYLASPNVTLRVQSYRSKRVYIDGEVKNAGLQAINDIPMTLTEALNRAGGMLPSADQSRIVLERGEKRYHIDLRTMVAKGINPGKVLLLPGDVVRVHSREESKVFVSGEVVSPKALTMHNGRLTLNEALGESGGISPMTGDARQVYVVRRTGESTRVFQLDARRKGALALAESFELHPKDLVYVAASPLANWHRSLSMIFPGALTQAVSVTRP